MCVYIYREREEGETEREREREREIESQVVDAAKAIEKESGTRAELLTIGALIIGIGFL